VKSAASDFLFKLLLAACLGFQILLSAKPEFLLASQRC
jgi:hypothetical protein